MLHLKPESVSWKLLKQLHELLQHFLCFKGSWSWTPVEGTHSLLLLEKVLYFQFYKQPHPPKQNLVKVFQTSGHSEPFSQTRTQRYHLTINH